jgi:hypothetical protein
MLLKIGSVGTKAGISSTPIDESPHKITPSAATGATIVLHSLCLSVLNHWPFIASLRKQTKYELYGG